MKPQHPNSRRLPISALLICSLAVSCVPATYKAIPDDQLSTTPRFQATVEEIEPCTAYLKAMDGKVIVIGGPAAGREIVRFVHTLEPGHTYTFPDVFLDYQKPRQ